MNLEIRQTIGSIGMILVGIYMLVTETLNAESDWKHSVAGPIMICGGALLLWLQARRRSRGNR